MDKIYVISKNSLRGKFHVEMKTLYTEEDVVSHLCDVIHGTYTTLAQDYVDGSLLNTDVHIKYDMMCGQTDPKELLEIYDQLIEDHDYHDKVEFSIGLKVIERMVESKPESYHDSEEKFWDNISTHNERFAYD